jgi:hypothetical protein
MNEKRNVLFTHQKHKKHKTWQDGTVKLSKNGLHTKVTLYDDKNAVLESIWWKEDALPEEEMEMERHLIQFVTSEVPVVTMKPRTRVKASTEKLHAFKAPKLLGTGALEMSMDDDDTQGKATVGVVIRSSASSHRPSSILLCCRC